MIEVGQGGCVEIGEGPGSVTLEAAPEMSVVVGVQGPSGPAGPAGGKYDYVQAVAAATWTVNHNLGYRPNVAVYTDGGILRNVEIANLNTNTLEVRFNSAKTGTAHCS